MDAGFSIGEPEQRIVEPEQRNAELQQRIVEPEQRNEEPEQRIRVPEQRNAELQYRIGETRLALFFVTSKSHSAGDNRLCRLTASNKK